MGRVYAERESDFWSEGQRFHVAQVHLLRRCRL